MAFGCVKETMLETKCWQICSEHHTTACKMLHNTYFFLFLFVYVEAESEENQIGYNALLMSFAFSLLSSKNAVVAAGIQKKMLKLISEWDRTLYYAMLL